MKEVTRTIKNKRKEGRGGFLSILLGILGAGLLENILAGKGIVRASSGRRSLNSYKEEKEIVRASYGKEHLFQSIIYQISKYKTLIR